MAYSVFAHVKPDILGLVDGGSLGGWVADVFKECPWWRVPHPGDTDLLVWIKPRYTERGDAPTEEFLKSMREVADLGLLSYITDSDEGQRNREHTQVLLKEHGLLDYYRSTES